MGEENNQQGSEPPQWFTEAVRRQAKFVEDNPLYEELKRQNVRLKNGAEMEWGRAQGCVAWLRDIQADRDYYPGIFAALVAAVKPRGVRHLPGKVSHEALDLAAGILPWIVRQDCSVTEDFAIVLDASYEAMKNGEGAVLVDPVAYTREFVEKWKGIVEKADREWDRINRRTHEQREVERRQKRGNGDGPPLG